MGGRERERESGRERERESGRGTGKERERERIEVNHVTHTSGMKRYLSPSPAPERDTPRKNRMRSTTYGKVAVK